MHLRGPSSLTSGLPKIWVLRIKSRMQTGVCIMQWCSRHWVSNSCVITTFIGFFHRKLLMSTRSGHILPPAWGTVLFQTSQVFITKENPGSLHSDLAIPNINFIQKGILCHFISRQMFPTTHLPFYFSRIVLLLRNLSWKNTETQYYGF